MVLSGLQRLAHFTKEDKMSKLNKLPLVVIETIDHTSSCGGVQERATPSSMVTSGWLLKETKQGYYIVHTVFENDPKDEHNVTSFIAKIPGHKVRRIR